MRIGVVTDVHHEVAPAAERRWINRFETTAVLGRLAAAVAGLRAQAVDVIVLLGDLTHEGDAASLAEVLASLGTGGAAAGAVAGNHDGPDPLTDDLRRHGVLALAAEPWRAGGVTLAGVDPEPSATQPGGWRLRGLPPGTGVLASHFPVLSEEARLRDAGLPYAGDLEDRADAAGALAGRGAPVVVLCGHIHARCTRAEGPVLQLAGGALVEPPFDVAVVEVTDGDRPEVRRTARRLGPRVAVDPVFAPAHERWVWDGDGWRAAGMDE
jgi:predicted phosphodiesterase